MTEIGKAALDCWQKIPEHFPFVELGSFVVMPNHVHGILIIQKEVGTETQNIQGTETQNLASLQDGRANKFGPESRNLASIIRGYKNRRYKICKGK